MPFEFCEIGIVMIAIFKLLITKVIIFCYVMWCGVFDLSEMLRLLRVSSLKSLFEWVNASSLFSFV